MTTSSRRELGKPSGVSVLELTRRAGDAGARAIDSVRLLRTAVEEVGEPKKAGAAFALRMSKLSSERGRAPLTIREMKFRGDGSCSRGCRPPPIRSAGGDVESERPRIQEGRSQPQPPDDASYSLSQRVQVK